MDCLCAAATDRAMHGFYCPLGTVDPLKCLPGNWCDGNASLPCPTGRYGSVENLGSPQCSGACNPGYYCPKGSTGPTQKPCPGGTYGSTEVWDLRRAAGSAWVGIIAQPHRQSAIRTNVVMLSFCPPGSPAPIPVWWGTILKVET